MVSYDFVRITILEDFHQTDMNATGKDVLIDYLKVNSKEQIAIVKDRKVKAG